MTMTPLSQIIIDSGDLLAALGLAFILEGVPYFLFADRMPAYLRLLSKTPPVALRLLGLIAMLAGLGVVYVARTLL